MVLKKDFTPVELCLSASIKLMADRTIRMPTMRADAANKDTSMNLRTAAYRWALPPIILLLSWGLLLWMLGNRSLWVDEYATTIMVRGSIFDAVRNAAADVHPPFYFVLLNVWSSLAGTSDFAFQFMSAAASVCAVAVMWPLSGWLCPSSSNGWRCAAMLAMACAPALVLFGRMSRYYSLVLLLSMLSTLALMVGLKGRRRAWPLYGLATTLMLYTFMPSIVLLLVQMVPVLQSRRRRAWLMAASIVVLLFLPWLVIVATRQVSTVQSFTAVPFSRNAVGWLLGAGMSLYSFSVGETLYPWSPLAGIGLIAIAIAAIVALVRGGWLARRLALMVTLGVVGVALIVNLLAVGTPFLNVPARGLFLLPYLTLLVVMGIAHMRHVALRGMVAGMLALAWGAGVTNDFAGAQFMNPIYVTPSKEAARWVMDRALPGDGVVADWEAAFDRYYAPLIAGGNPYIDSADIGQVKSALSMHPPARLWRVELGRDSKQIEALAQTDALIQQAYRLGDSQCLSPIDPTYKRFKDLALQRESYDCRLRVDRFDRVSP
jgi:hypothetical protein